MKHAVQVQTRDNMDGDWPGTAPKEPPGTVVLPGPPAR